MRYTLIINKALGLKPLSFEEACFLYDGMPTGDLAALADRIRYIHHPEKIVTWQIDRNVNITNVCVTGCKFCNFHCKPHDKDSSYITTIEQYSRKIDEMLLLGGDQLLLQGGMHPDLGLDYYESLFRELKRRYPNVKLHALGPPEIFFIAKKSGVHYSDVLKRLKEAGMDSLPGAGAEILCDEVRRIVSPAKCSVSDWLGVMAEAHRQGFVTSATMMYGHIEKSFQRIQHLIAVRDLQDCRPEGSVGFLAFIAWPYCGKGTRLEKEGVKDNHSVTEFIRLTAISRIVLNNISNIQVSWLTMGREAGQIALHCGANDMGSIMIEENVVSSAGVSFKMNREGMVQTIKEAGFEPRLRDQNYNYRNL